MIFDCCNEKRREAILSNAAITLNGIDYLEVPDQADSLALGRPPQQTLMIHCLKPVATALTPDNIVITGGESITNVTAIDVKITADPTVLQVSTSTAGDFSPYTLRLVGSVQRSVGNPFDVTNVLTGFDPQLAEVGFSFKVECNPNFDCAAPGLVCAPAPESPPPINYLAKDYGSFRTLILDRLSQLLPASSGASEADLGVVLAEAIAYKADSLSYQQDAIATEAYIQTARSRVSLRRHARLTGYRVHDGCNARAWVQLNVAAAAGEAVFLDRTLTRFYTYAPGMPATLAVGAGTETSALSAGVQAFEPMQDAFLYAEHNLMNFYTWGDTDCCLPRGATQATLQGSFTHLQPGDVLIFQEQVGPQTGNAADADLRHRCAVRLTQIATVDANGAPLVDPLFDASGTAIVPPAATPQTPAWVTEIQWATADALPFPLCISSTYLGSNGSVTPAPAVSVALGNVVLADHGLSLGQVDLGTVPAPSIFLPPDSASRCQAPMPPRPVPARYRPVIPDAPLTQVAALPLTGSPVMASAAMLDLTGFVSVPDVNGFVSMQVAAANPAGSAANPAGWPHYFGVIAQPNATTPANFDLAVVYIPQGATSSLVTVENFTNLSFKVTDPNNAAGVINTYSSLLRVPAGYSPPTAAPTSYPTTPTRLDGTGSINLTDLSTPPVTYLTLEVTPPAGWAPYVGVQPQQQNGAEYISVVYHPPTSGVGVRLPVTLETFSDASPEAIAVQVNAASQLVTARSFAGIPNIALSATELLAPQPADALPVISLQGSVEGTTTQWTAQQDLLSSSALDPVFVVEIDTDGTASLRFATPGTSSLDTNGLVPAVGMSMVAAYRIGNGSAGNVGAESLKFLATVDARIQKCLNPLPASGGTDPETNDQIRRRAPQGFLSQAPSALQRSVTLSDYQALTETNPAVHQAVASLRWTGSWYSVHVAVEPTGGGDLTATLEQTLDAALEPYRLAGQDLEFASPVYVSLQIALTVTVAPGYFRQDILQRLAQVLGSKALPDGTTGLFYAGNFTFGQSVYLSPVYAAARAVAGVVQVTATQFQPQGANTPQYLSAGQIPLGPLQVARLDNDPSYPTHGQLSLTLLGGK